MDFKFVFQGPWSEKQNILRQHMHKKEFWKIDSLKGFGAVNFPFVI
jgi:hypothetical protein